MSKSYRQDKPNGVFHVTARVIWRAWHLKDVVARLQLCKLLDSAAEEFGVKLFAFVLMANHFHLVLQSPADRLFNRLTSRRLPCRHRVPWPRGHQNASVIAQFMKKIRSSMTRMRNGQLGLTGQFWDGRYDCRPVFSPLSLAVRIAYDHRNPVKAGIVSTPEEYRWSSAGDWACGRPGEVRIELNELPFELELDAFRPMVTGLQNAEPLDRMQRLPQILRVTTGDDEQLQGVLQEHGIVIP